MTEIYYVAYQDDGPIGPCGQSCATTNPWDKLYIFTNRKKMREFVDPISEGTYTARRNARITNIWEEEFNVVRCDD